MVDESAFKAHPRTTGAAGKEMGQTIVHTPLLTFGRTVGRQPGLKHVGDREQPLSARGVFHPRPRPYRTGTPGTGGGRDQLIEHMSETTGLHRPIAQPRHP